MRKKKMMISLCMAAVMTGSMALPALAAGPGAVNSEQRQKLEDNTLEYEELEQLVHVYNVTVVNNRVSYEKAEADSSGISQADVYWQSANDAQEAAEAARAASDAALGNAKLKAIAAGAEAAAQQAVSQAENNMNSMETTKLNYDKLEKSTVMQAQATMNTLQQLQLQLEPLNKNRELLEAVVLSTQTRKDLGMATQADVLTAQQNVQSMNAQIANLENQIKTAKQKLCIMTGWQAAANPEIMPVPETDLNRITAMNLEQDTAKALEQDYTLKIDNMKLKNAGSLENTQMMEKTVANDKEQIASAVNTAYQNTMQAKAAYDQAVLDFEIAAKSMSAADTKYQLGSLSKLEHLKEQAAYVTAQAAKEAKNLALFQAMETYDWAVRGVR